MLIPGLILVAAGLAIGQENDPEIDGKPVSQLIKQLRSENRGLQLRAAQSLAKASTNDMAKIVPQLIPVLQSERENDKFVAAQILGEYGPSAKPAVPDILPMLGGTQYERNRAAAAKALGLIFKDAQPGEEPGKIAQALIKVFDDKYSDVRREAVTACGVIGPAAKACIPHLPALFEDFARRRDGESKLVERAAAWTCGRMGPLAAEHMDRLISMMHGQTYPEVVEAIGAVGAVQDNVVKNVLSRMEKVMNVPDLMLYELKGRDYAPTCFATLEKFGPKAKEAVPMMVRHLTEQPSQFPGPHIPLLAARVLGAIGPDAKDAIPDLEKLVKTTRDSKVKEAATGALAKIRGGGEGEKK